MSDPVVRPPTLHLTPMLRQYLAVKAQHPDAIVLYRMGDFFEMFFDDAVKAAPILEVQLTARQRGSDNEAPMCGVPHHALDTYLAKLLAAGLKAAICDQVEDPAKAKGLVRREVVRVVTPGTLSDPGLLDSREENLLAAVAWSEGRGRREARGPRGEPGAAGPGPAGRDAPGERPAIGAGAFLDVSTGDFFVRRWASVEEAADDLALLRPRELLLAGGAAPPAAVSEWAERDCPCVTALEGDRLLDPRRAAELLQRHFGTGTLRGFGLQPDEPAVLAAAAALAYARETQRSELAHVQALAVREVQDRLVLDAATLANLEVFRPAGAAAAAATGPGRRRVTLLGVLDHTATPPGGRLLREWLRRPLRDPEAIGRRHQAVAELAADHPRRERLRGRLARAGDPERLLARAVLGTLMPREAAALRDGLAEAPAILAEIAAAAAPLLGELAAADPLPGLAAELARVLEPAPAANLDEGGVIAAGVDPELDRYRSLTRDSKRHVLALEARERERTGIASLKARYNRVFGYYLEVSNANQARVPADYIRRQTLANAERYVTTELKELEEQILAAEERQVALEVQHFQGLTATVAAAAAGLHALAAALGALDVLASFAEVAARQRYGCPQMLPAGGPIAIREGRHPVVEQASRDAFVPNDVELDAESAQIVLLTGPNMGGKSTYLRQVALIVLMAQAGSLVPAESAAIGVVDRIFTRVGASDDLARGESTFMVEMIETANILRHATEHSLVILDEVGRGTATFDGLSLAWAIVEHLHEHRRPKTLFATHYHELTELAALLPRVVNRTMAVKEWDERIVFLRRVVPGSADKSYGLHVARLAGLPPAVIERAAEILANLESQEYDLAGRPRLARGHAPAAAADPAQLTLFAPPEQVVASLLRAVDLDQLSPLAALNLLHSLKSRLG
ncbi:MAG TPA: DNA mismatch repair protein MutS [Thermoanaerobaculia bacterium]|nr:DNA mismatch repair protein MutS [Thermoanaerobaculia bacterium]